MENLSYKKFLSDSFKDMQEDFDELLYLYSSSLSYLQTFFADLIKSKNNIPKGSYQTVLTQTKVYINDFSEGIIFLKAVKEDIKNAKQTATKLKEYSDIKEKYFHLLRSQQGLIGALITSTDWQSPSFYHTTQSFAGRQTGQITPNYGDYKRDEHMDERPYQQAFLQEYVDGFVKLPVRVYLTNSGMAAFTTILNFLFMENKIKVPLLIGKSAYHENEELVSKILGKHVVTVNESDTETIIKTIKEKNPSVIIFDSLTNTEEVALPDLKTIITYLVKNAKKDIYVVIDNTCLSIHFQPLSLVLAKNKNVHLVVFESLLKYHQFGMDRVTGGIIWAYGKDVGELFYTREHSGTNILDSSVYALPKPNRKVLTKRLRRFERNTKVLAHYLSEKIKEKNTIFDGINYPAISYHRAFLQSQKMSFHGSFFTISFKKDYKNVKTYKRFVTAIIEEAKRQDVNIVSGTSFGFNTTRIYLTALKTDFAIPFIRVSVGTEHRLDLEKIKNVFSNVIDKFH